MFHHPELASFLMSAHIFNDDPFNERLLDLKLTAVLKWNTSIWAIARGAGRMMLVVSPAPKK